MEPRPAKRRIWNSGNAAFFISGAVFAVGYLMYMHLWRDGGIALMTIGALGTLVYKWAYDWRHPFRR
jgi:hypothetical protein